MKKKKTDTKRKKEYEQIGREKNVLCSGGGKDKNIETKKKYLRTYDTHTGVERHEHIYMQRKQ